LTRLIEWIFEEIFQPGERRFPLIGTVEGIEGINFGERQILLMHYLSGNKGSNCVIKASINIVKLYFKKFQPEVLKLLLEKFGEDLDISLVSLYSIQCN
jgi:hypothetical protein